MFEGNKCEIQDIARTLVLGYDMHSKYPLDIHKAHHVYSLQGKCIRTKKEVWGSPKVGFPRTNWQNRSPQWVKYSKNF